MSCEAGWIHAVIIGSALTCDQIKWSSFGSMDGLTRHHPNPWFSCSCNASVYIEKSCDISNPRDWVLKYNIAQKLNRRIHDDVIKWKHFPCYLPFVMGIHRSPVDSPRKDQWRGALMFSVICAWTNDWSNNRDAGDLRRHRAHSDVTIMQHHNYKAIYHEFEIGRDLLARRLNRLVNIPWSWCL